MSVPHEDLDLEQKFSSDEVLLYRSSKPRVVDLRTSIQWLQIRSALFSACSNGDVKKVKNILEQNNIDVNVKLDGGYTPLVIATKCGHAKLGRFLLSQPGIDVLVKDPDGTTALRLALRALNWELAHYLIKVGANIDEEDKTGMTALLDAWYADNQEVANQLIVLGANINLNEQLFNSDKNSADLRFNILQSASKKDKPWWDDDLEEIEPCQQIPESLILLKRRHELVPQQIALSKQFLAEYLNNAKFLGIDVERLCFKLPEDAKVKIAECLFEQDSLSIRAFNMGRNIIQEQLSTPNPIPRSLLFMGNFEDRMRNIGDELFWEKLKEEYNAINPGREEHGYGLGAMVVYKPKP
jgi:hypothetical protein